MAAHTLQETECYLKEINITLQVIQTMDLKKIISNKKIALIGNAASLFEKEYGKDIDSHDVVCRINKGPVLCTTRNENSHGMRTDILFYGDPAIIEGVIPHLPDEIIYILTHVKYKDKKHPEGNLYKISQSQYDKFKRESGYTEKGKWPSSGLSAIFLLLDYKPQLISLYGFDWKETPTFYKKGTRENELRHNFELEKKIINDLSNLVRIHL